MDKEQGEKRDFLPDFFADFINYDTSVYLEKGYGEKLGYIEEDYLQVNPNISFVKREEVFNKDLIVVIRSPEYEWIKQMKPNSSLLSMLHYETRPALLKLLKEKKINAFSLDSIVDDDFKRMMVTYEMTAYGGVYHALEHIDKSKVDNRPLKVTIMGLGNLGVEAGRCFSRLYNEFNLKEKNIHGVRVEYLEREITPFKEELKAIFEETDILVDATKRPDPEKVIIPNSLLNYLPEHAVVLDLTADPYEEKNGVQQGKAIEGLPHGNIDEYVFPVSHGKWNELPGYVDSDNRRLAISCNAWPSVTPDKCMEVYGKKIRPFIDVLLRNGTSLDAHSKDLYERALYRSTIPYFEKQLTAI
ncbi:alanine dehydrogenase [Pseudalkalibacillus caeni]|uniref:Alanine dehydrogenase n=1 Tax=Exobacillus caeni TaxID=2574798 RepID=A0A5R9F9T3_9BACL|nr:alanine dehydrogenase [Pseudalkalibacillus caeni]TLS38398.1 alanine dehydrogenase [Pseudalkalibacillus caeni]